MAATATLQAARTPGAVVFDPQALRGARRAAGLTLIDVAARTGRSWSVIGRYERGEVSPSADVIADLCLLYSVSPGDLWRART